MKHLTANTNIEISKEIYQEFIGAVRKVKREPTKALSLLSYDSCYSLDDLDAEQLSRQAVNRSLQKGLDAVI